MKKHPYIERVRRIVVVLFIPITLILACQDNQAAKNAFTTMNDTIPGSTASPDPQNTQNAQNSPGEQSAASSASEESPDSIIKVHPDQTFDIRLRCAAGQGYSWQLTDSNMTNIRESSSQTFEPLPDSKPGSDGIQIFHFKALHTGKETLHFIYVQPFVKPYPATAPRKVFYVFIQ